MYMRITRFTDCDPEAMERVVSEVDSRDAPPEGVPSSGLEVVVDKSSNTMVFIGYFETEEDLRQGDEALRKMDPPGGTPGARSTVDMGEVRVQKRM